MQNVIMIAICLIGEVYALQSEMRVLVRPALTMLDLQRLRSKEQADEACTQIGARIRRYEA